MFSSEFSEHLFSRIAGSIFRTWKFIEFNSARKLFRWGVFSVPGILSYSFGFNMEIYGEQPLSLSISWFSIPSPPNMKKHRTDKSGYSNTFHWTIPRPVTWDNKEQKNSVLKHFSLRVSSNHIEKKLKNDKIRWKTFKEKFLFLADNVTYL